MMDLRKSLPLAVILAALIYGGVELVRAPRATDAPAIQAIREQLAGATADITSLTTRLDALDRQLAAARPQEAQALAGQERAKDLYPRTTEDLREYVFALLEEDRELRREESRQRQGEREKELAALREGPYGNLNLKVNSMAQVLGLDGNQKDRYHELHVSYREKASKEREGLDWRNREARQGAMDEYRKLEDEFSAQVKGLLTAEQAAIYDTLPTWSRSMFNPGYVSAPGQEGEAVRTNIQEFLRGMRERRRQ